MLGGICPLSPTTIMLLVVDFTFRTHLAYTKRILYLCSLSPVSGLPIHHCRITKLGVLVHQTYGKVLLRVGFQEISFISKRNNADTVIMIRVQSTAHIYTSLILSPSVGSHKNLYFGRPEPPSVSAICMTQMVTITRRSKISWYHTEASIYRGRT